MMNSIEKQLILPEGGIKDQEFWVVDVSYSSTNIIHRAILATGFLKNGMPGSYAQIWSNRYSELIHPSEAHYLKYISKIEGMK